MFINKNILKYKKDNFESGNDDIVYNITESTLQIN